MPENAPDRTMPPQEAAGPAPGAEGTPSPPSADPSPQPAGGAAPSGAPDRGADPESLSALELMLDVPLEVTVELGRTTMQLGEALGLQSGSIIELNRLPGEPLDMHINDRLVARGEVVVVSETLGLRITEIVGNEGRKSKSASTPG